MHGSRQWRVIDHAVEDEAGDKRYHPCGPNRTNHDALLAFGRNCSLHVRFSSRPKDIDKDLERKPMLFE
jgi:hypothetical protein